MTTFRLIEGFDVYPDVHATSYGVQARWLATPSSVPYNSVALSAGRFTGQSVSVAGVTVGGNPGIAYATTAQGSGDSNLTLGFAFNLSISVTQIEIITFKNGGPTGSNVVGVGVNSSQQLYLWRGSSATILATTSISITTGSWHYIEIELFSSAGAGTMTLWLDGVRQLNFSGNTGGGTIDTVGLGTVVSPFTSAVLGLYDDIYVTNTNVRLGERRVETLYPNANSAVSWTPLANTNWQEVSSTLNGGDAAYVSTNTPGNQDLYTINPLSSNPLIIDAVQTSISVRKDDASTHTLVSSLQSGATTVNGASYAVAGTYLYDIDIFTTDPNTSAAWTPGGVNASKIGQKLTT